MGYIEERRKQNKQRKNEQTKNKQDDKFIQ